jgi:hypothetical protein
VSSNTRLSMRASSINVGVVLRGVEALLLEPLLELDFPRSALLGFFSDFLAVLLLPDAAAVVAAADANALALRFAARGPAPSSRT